jgi:hypothetical protein
VNEILTTAVQHRGDTEVTITTAGGHVVVEIRDHGTGPSNPIIACLPSPEALHGRGRWPARKLCDDGTVQWADLDLRVRLSPAAQSPASRR